MYQLIKKIDFNGPNIFFLAEFGKEREYAAQLLLAQRSKLLLSIATAFCATTAGKEPI